MQMFYFESKAIHGACYDPDTRTLFIQFESGEKIYEYPDVPEYVFGGLLAAESKGKYYASYIRDQFIPYD
jgi:KTSC domain-containing protein